MRLRQIFSSIFHKYRHLFGLSQEMFEAKANLHQTFSSYLERGKHRIALDNIEKIANAHEIETHIFYLSLILMNPALIKCEAES